MLLLRGLRHGAAALPHCPVLIAHTGDNMGGYWADSQIENELAVDVCIIGCIGCFDWLIFEI